MEKSWEKLIVKFVGTLSPAPKSPIFIVLALHGSDNGSIPARSYYIPSFPSPIDSITSESRQYRLGPAMRSVKYSGKWCC